MSDETMSWNDAIAHIMAATGKNRRQAKAALLEACRQGRVRATGVRTDTGEVEAIPPEDFPAVN